MGYQAWPQMDADMEADLDALDDWCQKNQQVAAGLAVVEAGFVLGVAVEPAGVAAEVGSLVRRPDRVTIRCYPRSLADLRSLMVLVENTVEAEEQPWSSIREVAPLPERGLVQVTVSNSADAEATGAAADARFGPNRVEVVIGGGQIW